MQYNFWRSNNVRLRAVEQRDLEELLQSPTGPDSESERADASIGFPLSRVALSKVYYPRIFLQ